MTMDDRIEELRAKREAAAKGGGEDRIAKQHDKGKMTARERIDYFVDDGTFHEFDQFRTHRNHTFGMEEKQIATDGVVTGYGEVNGRTVFVFAHDFTVFGGSLGEVFAEKICKVMDKAMEVGAPVVGLNDSAGARIQEGVGSLGGFGEIFQRNTDASGVIPQISGIMGPCAGGAVYSPAITDFVFMVKDTSHMFITGPDVVETVTGEEVSFDELGGAVTHASTSGAAHFAVDDEKQALDEMALLLSYLPQNNVEDPPRVDPWDDPDRRTDALTDIVPDAPKKPYDATNVVEEVVDEGSFFEVHESYAKNIVVGFGRLDGHSVGIVANQPRVNAGTLDIEASEKGARFVRFCDAFNIPIVTLVDVPGFMPGTTQEYGGIIIHGAKLLFAYGEATVPKVTITLRKSYGGAHDVMSCKQLRGDMNYAWPTAEIAVMGAQGAVEVLYGKELKNIEDEEERQKFIDEKVDEYKEKFANPYQAASLGYIDDVIEPRNSRFRVIRALQMLATKKDQNPPKKHSNIPL